MLSNLQVGEAWCRGPVSVLLGLSWCSFAGRVWNHLQAHPLPHPPGDIGSRPGPRMGLELEHQHVVYPWGCLGFLMLWWLTVPGARVGEGRAQPGRSCFVFYDLASEVMQRSFQHLWGRGSSQRPAHHQKNRNETPPLHRGRIEESADIFLNHCTMHFISVL